MPRQLKAQRSRMLRVTAPLFFLNETPKGTDIMELETLQALYVDELKDLWSP